MKRSTDQYFGSIENELACRDAPVARRWQNLLERSCEPEEEKCLKIGREEIEENLIAAYWG